MPRSDTGDLPQTLVRLSGKLLGAPSAGDTGETLTLGDGNAVNHLVLLEDGADLDGLLEESAGESDLVDNASSVDLDLHQVGLLLLQRRLSDLGVGEDTDDGAVFLDALELAGDGGAGGLGVLLGVLGECLLLALVPVLVESALDFVGKMFGPDGGERAETAGSLNVANETNGNELRSVSDANLPWIGFHTGGVSMTVTASTTSFLCILAPGRSRSRTMVVIPAL